jgi:TonB family protein
MKTFGIAIAALAFAGCAATSASTPTPVAAPASTAGNYSFPERISDDGLRDAVADYEQLIDRSYSGSVEAQVNVCVRPTGTVEQASIASSSGIRGFDRAVAAAASTWKYERATAANAKTRCKTVNVVYQSQI